MSEIMRNFTSDSTHKQPTEGEKTLWDKMAIPKVEEVENETPPCLAQCLDGKLFPAFEVESINGHLIKMFGQERTKTLFLIVTWASFSSFEITGSTPNQIKGPLILESPLKSKKNNIIFWKKNEVPWYNFFAIDANQSQHPMLKEYLDYNNKKIQLALNIPLIHYYPIGSLPMNQIASNSNKSFLQIAFQAREINKRSANCHCIPIAPKKVAFNFDQPCSSSSIKTQNWSEERTASLLNASIFDDMPKLAKQETVDDHPENPSERFTIGVCPPIEINASPPNVITIDESGDEAEKELEQRPSRTRKTKKTKSFHLLQSDSPVLSLQAVTFQNSDKLLKYIQKLKRLRKVMVEKERLLVDLEAFSPPQ